MTLLKTPSKMKSGFEYCYRPNRGAVDDILRKGILFFDTNVLLDVFRVENKSAQTLLKVFDSLKERVRLPYHVVEEYHDEYFSVLVSQKVALQNAVKALKDKDRGVQSLLKGSDYSKLSKYAKTIMLQDLQKASDSIVRSFTKTIKHLENEIQNDLIINKLSDIFSGDVLSPMTKDELECIYTEGVTRYNHQVPPGYKDVAEKDKDGIVKKCSGERVKEDRNNVFGDLVIWSEVLKYAKEKQADAVFVCNDIKEDWVCEICGEKHGPRVELLEEFYRETGGHTLIIYTFEQFILKLNALESIVSDSELHTMINSLEDSGKREERSRIKSAEKTFPESKAGFQSEFKSTSCGV